MLDRAEEMRSDDVAALFERYRARGDRRTRNALVERHLHLADYHTRRFAARGAPREDIHQVALMGIIAAVERFDPARGVSFATFASRTIDGECKRFLRDRTWAVRPPRRTQELHLRQRRVQEELTHQIGLAPTVAELAAALGETEERVLEAMEAGAAQHAYALDAPSGAESEDSSTRSVLAQLDHRLGDVEQRQIVAGLLDGLGDRERRILELRFFANLGQPEIARRLGVSQSYLSRVLRKILAELRGRLDGEG